MPGRRRAARVFGNLMIGAEGAGLGFAMAQNLRFSGLDRLFTNPMVSIGLFDSPDPSPAVADRPRVERIQIVPLPEVGRVAGACDLGELHPDMNRTVGTGLRAWVKGFVVAS